MSAEKLHVGLNALRKSEVLYPQHPEPRFLVAILHADHILGLQGVFNTGKQGALMAQLASVGVLKKCAAIRHPPDADDEIDCHADFRCFLHGAGKPS